MFFTLARPVVCQLVSLLGGALLLFGFSPSLTASPADSLEASQAQLLGRLPLNQSVPLALTLPLRHQDQLNDLLRRLSDRHDPTYRQFLTPTQFIARFAPSPQDYAAVVAFAQVQGLHVVRTHSNRTVLDVEGTAGTVENTFSVRLLHYQAPTGRNFFAPDAEPTLSASLAGRLSGVVGLSTARTLAPLLAPLRRGEPARVATVQTGSGPLGGLTPSDIKTAYNLTSLTGTGAGQTLGLFELDGYNEADVQAYEAEFSLPEVPLQNVLVDGFSGQPSGSDGSAEVTLDIELQAALSPGANRILVYEGPNSSTGLVDTFNQMATDDQAQEISVSWGSAEQFGSGSEHAAENAIFQQMAAQGQTIYAASGDRGAQNFGQGPVVLDPASQPYMVSVGGTSLVTNGPGGAWQGETTWNNGNGNATGGASAACGACPPGRRGWPPPPTSPPPRSATCLTWPWMRIPTPATPSTIMAAGISTVEPAAPRRSGLPSLPLSTSSALVLACLSSVLLPRRSIPWLREATRQPIFTTLPMVAPTPFILLLLAMMMPRDGVPSTEQASSRASLRQALTRPRRRSLPLLPLPMLMCRTASAIKGTTSVTKPHCWSAKAARPVRTGSPT